MEPSASNAIPASTPPSPTPDPKARWPEPSSAEDGVALQSTPHPEPIHVLASFAHHDEVIQSTRSAQSWCILTPDQAERALLPSLTHILNAGPNQTPLQRLDEIDDPQILRRAIRRLADQLELKLDQPASAAPGAPAEA